MVYTGNIYLMRVMQLKLVILLSLLMLNPPGAVEVEGNIIKVHREDGTIVQVKFDQVKNAVIHP